MMSKLWTDAEVTELRTLAGVVSAKDISQHLGRSIKAVNRKADNEGISLAVPRASKQAPAQKKRKFDPADPTLRSSTVHALRKGTLSTDELAEMLDVTARDAALMIDSLGDAGYHMSQVNGRHKIGKILAHTAPTRVSTQRFSGPEMAFGVIADSHMASTHCRLDVLESAYNEFAKQKIKTVYALGNMIDGFAERINGSEVMLRNVTDQCAYMADHMPQRSGMTTEFITGDCHEGWYAKDVGLNIGHHMEDEAKRHGRTDLKYIGHMEADVELKRGSGSSIMRLFHPGGGSAYAQSYKPQKIIESYQGGEKPSILLLGHYHKFGFFYPRNVWCFMAGCLQDQTMFMRKRQLSAHVGFAILRVTLDMGGGVATVVPKFFPFYDRGYHVKQGDSEWERALWTALGKDH